MLRGRNCPPSHVQWGLDVGGGAWKYNLIPPHVFAD